MSDALSVEPAAVPSPSRLGRLLGLIALGNGVLRLAQSEALIKPANEIWGAQGARVSQAALGLAASAQIVLVPLAALVVDRIPWGRARRRNWLILATLSCAALWGSFDPARGGAAIVIAEISALTFFMALLGTTLTALAADTGRRHDATGAVSGSGRIGFSLALLGTWLARPLLEHGGSTAVARIFAGGFLLLGLLLWLVPAEGSRPPPPEAGYQRKAFWSIVLLALWLEIVNDVTSVLLSIRDVRSSQEATMAAQWPGMALLCVGAALYLRFARRLDARRLPALGVGLAGAALVLAMAWNVSSPVWRLDGRALLLGLATLPVMDLAFRHVRPGREAFGMWTCIWLPRFVVSAGIVPLARFASPEPPSSKTLLAIWLGLLALGGVTARFVSLRASPA